MNTASRYDGCEALKDGTREYLGLRVSLDIAPRPDDRFHTVVAGDRLDVLAHRYLGDARLWWVICDCNGGPSPLSMHLLIGITLRIPSTGWLGKVS